MPGVQYIQRGLVRPILCRRLWQISPVIVVWIRRIGVPCRVGVSLPLPSPKLTQRWQQISRNKQSGNANDAAGVLDVFGRIGIFGFDQFTHSASQPPRSFFRMVVLTQLRRVPPGLNIAEPPAVLLIFRPPSS